MKIICKLTSIMLMCLFAYKAGALPSPYYSGMYMYDSHGEQDQYYLDPHAEPMISDPFVIVNKHIFSFNSTMDTVFISPAIEMYLTAVPKHGRDCVGNFLNNITEPLNFINLVFQGDFSQARVTLGRFITNSILGFFGIMDVATDLQMKYKSEDFGQTLAYYGAPVGPYIVLPFFGPSSVRDSTGKVVDFVLDPVGRELNSDERTSIGIITAVHKRAKMNEVIKFINSSLDPYETAKALYIQNRMDQINN